jgi:hypothetical protein
MLHDTPFEVGINRRDRRDQKPKELRCSVPAQQLSWLDGKRRLNLDRNCHCSKYHGRTKRYAAVLGTCNILVPMPKS